MRTNLGSWSSETRPLREEHRLQVAGVTCIVQTDLPLDSLAIDPAYLAFADLARHDPENQVHVLVRGHYDGLPDFNTDASAVLFDSGVHTRVLDCDGGLLVKLCRGDRPYCLSRFRSDFREVDVCVDPNACVPGDPLFHPLTHPIHHMLMISVLSQGHGISLHAAGADLHGRGYLFTGPSGAGKSTISRLLAKHATILNDERIVLRLQQGRLWIYGTPWLGENNVCAQHGLPLDKLFFIHHAAENSARPLQGAPVATELLTHTALPFWSRSGMQFVTDFCGYTAENARCYRLGFAPDERILDFLPCVP